jgi:transitional endoplasmic reticulum ATPase
MDQLQHSGASDIEKNLDTLQEMFDSDEVEKEICLLLFLLSIYEEVQNLFQYHLRCDRFSGRNYLATILGSNTSAISQALCGKLSGVGIIEPDRGRCICMDSDFVNLLQNASGSDIRTEFFRKVGPDPVPLDAHMIDSHVMDHVLQLLKAKPLSSSHVIFYGPPGTGKTSLAYGIGKALGLPTFLRQNPACLPPRTPLPRQQILFPSALQIPTVILPECPSI